MKEIILPTIDEETAREIAEEEESKLLQKIPLCTNEIKIDIVEAIRNIHKRLKNYLNQLNN